MAVALAAPAHAWGPLGHRIVAESAALLVQDDLPETWGPLLARHRFALGIYAFVPDSRFRHTDGRGGKLEGPTHYVNLDAPHCAPRGSVDRRVAQFAARAGADLHPVTKPVGGYVAGATADGDVRRIYLGLLDLGLMAHYSGDASMPYHAAADSNGFAAGEGGIHYYFENDCVDAFEPGLAEEVLAVAREKRSAWTAAWSAAGTTPEALVGAVLKDSLAAVAKVSEIDKRDAVITPSRPGGKTPAVRKPPVEGCRSLRPIVVERLAKGAVLTAIIWESVLPRTGVDFKGASSLLFSDLVSDPAYVPPDY